MSKIIEFFEDMKAWRVFGACEDSEFERLWGELQNWIEKQQPYGFFRAVDDIRPLDDIFREHGLKK